MSDEPKPLGRPLIAIDMEKLAKLMQFDPKREDVAHFMECSIDTIERRIKEETGLTYLEFKDKNMAGVRQRLTQQALKMAMDGDVVMLNRCLNHFVGWSDKGSGVQVNVQNNIDQSVTVERIDLEDRIRQIRGEDGEA